MNKTYKIALGLFLLLVISLVWLETSEPEPVNWNPSYTATDKIALGSFVFYENWKDKAIIKKINIPPYEYLNDKPDSATYFFLNDFVGFDDDELDDLLNWVSQGNTVFISSNGFSGNLMDTLKIDVSYYYSVKEFASRPRLNLSNPKLKFKKNKIFDQDMAAVYFSKIDTLHQVVLGTASFGDDKNPEEKVNFVQSDFGKGTIYLHTNPQAFSNYFLLKDSNFEYTGAVLAYLSGSPILWDAYYKSGKTFFSSPLYMLLSHRSLKWAYYLVIITAILFVLFEGKRRQRPVPVVKPLANKSYEYTETISQLYLEKGRYYELGMKKINLFLEFIRNHYRLNTTSLNEEFYRNLADKSGNSYKDTKDLFERIFIFQQNAENEKEEFYHLSKSINNFKNKNGTSGQQ